ncbi:hypothetical protein ASF58_01650 [Methylobacterium sp. Leaf125]|uniref:hypothetical protein n=1 Tax=Methylobacterium sp. Leaf125 TaxID=1736265 RepID=UPI0006FA31EC|nr:hypothetical protein [Methylobacterium sp. Leaf125]KQQ48077.1 hypothetical protein ASF58_01650 [Methylobacterium sp. Leaf125]
MRRGGVTIRRDGTVLALLAGLLAAPAGAADLGGLAFPTPGRAVEGYAPEPESLPRYFPRAEEDGGVVNRSPVPRRRLAGCIARRVPIPTDAPGDPSYVGSAYGLGKPSYYGFTPPLGVDDPYGRPLRPYCP